MDVGIARVVADLFRLNTRPGRRGNDLTWLCNNIIVGDLIFMATFLLVNMIDTGLH